MLKCQFKTPELMLMLCQLHKLISIFIEYKYFLLYYKMLSCMSSSHIVQGLDKLKIYIFMVTAWIRKIPPKHGD